MKDLCLPCYNRQHHTHLTENQVILSASDDLEVCPHCGKLSRVVVRIPSPTPWGWLSCQYWKIMDKLGR